MEAHPVTATDWGSGMSQPLLSLAVIVRDQAPLLKTLLADHHGLYDEAVVVDTGSIDESVGVAARGGARVISTQWCQDFSQARNLALKACRGTWILVLDCDEVILAADQTPLRAQVARSKPCLMVLDQRNYTDQSQALGFRAVMDHERGASRGAPGYFLRRQIRIFPSGYGLCYEGVIHETLEQSTLKHCLKKVCLDQAIHHYGHLEGSGGRRRRTRRNGELLRREVRCNPHDPVLLTELAVQLVAEGRREEARKICRRALEVSPSHPELYQTRLTLAGLLLTREPQKALALGERALEDRPDLAQCWADATRLNAAAGHLDRARLLCRQGQRLFPLDDVLRQLETQVSEPAADTLRVENG